MEVRNKPARLHGERSRARRGVLEARTPSGWLECRPVCIGICEGHCLSAGRGVTSDNLLREGMRKESPQCHIRLPRS